MNLLLQHYKIIRLDDEHLFLILVHLNFFPPRSLTDVNEMLISLLISQSNSVLFVVDVFFSCS